MLRDQREHCGEPDGHRLRTHRPDEPRAVGAREDRLAVARHEDLPRQDIAEHQPHHRRHDHQADRHRREPRLQQADGQYARAGHDREVSEGLLRVALVCLHPLAMAEPAQSVEDGQDHIRDGRDHQEARRRPSDAHRAQSDRHDARRHDEREVARRQPREGTVESLHGRAHRGRHPPIVAASRCRGPARVTARDPGAAGSHLRRRLLRAGVLTQSPRTNRTSRIRPMTAAAP